MLLATVDVERLTRKGYSVEFFARFGRDGYVTLRNRRGRCVFYDVAKHCCRVYADRPLGCRIYPVMHDEDKGIVVDGICPARGTVTEKQKVKLGEKVLKLLEKIDAEAEERCSA